MTTIFATGIPQDIPMVLANKDERAAVQRQLVRQYANETIVAAKLNIPGPVKANHQLSRVFKAGMMAWDQLLHTHEMQQTVMLTWDRATGMERFERLTADAASVKSLAVQFEDNFSLGRFFDLDVLQAASGGQAIPLSRSDLVLPVRSCFICGRPAKECARSRRHSVADLQATISQQVRTYFREIEETDAN